MAPPLIHQITLAILSVRYGAVNVTIHDGRIVQIEKIEKIRVSPSADLPAPRLSAVPSGTGQAGKSQEASLAVSPIEAARQAGLSTGSSPYHWPTDRTSGGSRLVNGH